MTDRISTVALGDLTERLRRLYSLTGDIRPELELDAKLFLLVDDLRAPGLATAAGRRFRSYSYWPGATNLWQKWRPGFNCVLTRVMCMYSALSANPPTLRYIPPGVADAGVAYAALTTCGWVENTLSTTEKPVIEVAGNGTTGLGHAIGIGSPTAGLSAVMLAADLHMPAGSVLEVRNQGVETCTNACVIWDGYRL